MLSSKARCLRGAKLSKRLPSWCAPIVLQRPTSSSATSVHSRCTLSLKLDVSRLKHSFQVTDGLIWWTVAFEAASNALSADRLVSDMQVHCQMMKSACEDLPSRVFPFVAGHFSTSIAVVIAKVRAAHVVCNKCDACRVIVRLSYYS